jgi:exopolysaccharide biosynthesis polyprenyl glycosylphosphotransferase
MKRQPFQAFFVASQILVDAAALTLALQVAYQTRFFWRPLLRAIPALKGVPDIGLYHSALVALLPMCLVVFSYVGFYQNSLLSAYDEFVRVVKGMFVVYLITGAMTFAYRGAEYSRLVAGLWAVFCVVLLYVLRECNKALFRHLLYRFTGPRHVLVIGSGKVRDAVLQMASRQPFVRTHYRETMPSSAELEKLTQENHISEVLLIQGSVSPQGILLASRILEQLNIDCRVIPDLLEMRRGEIIVDGFCGLPTFHIKSLSLYGADYYFKRLFDVSISILILVVMFVPFLFVALLIRLDSPGPVLFAQYRLGFRGRKFRLFKFRTMVADADQKIEPLKQKSERLGPVFKMKNDPRITRVGKWLRRYSFDEIPQIINVLKGDMSLVGPRPQVLWEAAHYDDHAKRRLRIKPGITGLWQVSGRAALSYEEMINLDIYYLENWSLGLDLKILLRTVPAIFDKEGAY